MSEYQIDDVVSEITTANTFYHILPDTTDPLPMRCLALPQLSWEPKYVARRMHLVLPTALQELWDRTSGLVLFEDLTYRQWGLVVWSPDQAIIRHQRFAAKRMSDSRQLRRGDFIIGEFLGDRELPIIRCDPNRDDFGSIVIAQEIDPRDEWPTVAASLGEFLQTFLRTNLARFGVKYWDY